MTTVLKYRISLVALVVGGVILVANILQQYVSLAPLRITTPLFLLSCVLVIGGAVPCYYFRSRAKSENDVSMDHVAVETLAHLPSQAQPHPHSQTNEKED